MKTPLKQALAVGLLFAGGAFAQDLELLRSGRFEQAVSAYEQLADADKTASVLNRLGISYHMLGRFREAEAAYRLAIRRDSEAPAPRNNLGALLYTQRKFGDADGEFRRAADRDGDTVALHANLAAVRYARDNERAARNRAAELASESPLLIQPVDGDFLQILSLLPAAVREDARMHELRGDSYAARKMFDDAVIEYKKSLASDRYNGSVANRLGIAYHNLRKTREAEQQYRDALRLRPNYLDAMNNLGVLDYVRKNYEGALSRYTKALKLQPKSVTLLRNLGACLFSMERWDEGMRAYEQALNLDPLLFERQAGSGAGTFIQMSQQGSAMMNLSLAKIFASRNNTDLAISFLYKAIEAGLDDIALVTGDQAFKPLASDERFGRVLETFAAQKSRT